MSKKYTVGCRKCRKNHKNEQECNEKCHYQNPICVYLSGKMIGDHLYQSPLNSYTDRQETINLKTINYIRRCNVQGTYGELENKGLLFQCKDKTEIQVNYCSEKQAGTEYEILTRLLSEL